MRLCWQEIGKSPGSCPVRRFVHYERAGADIPRLRRAIRGIFDVSYWRKQAGGAAVAELSQFVFVHLLQWAFDREVMKPVDRIWALTGLAEAELQKAVTPSVDYSDNAPRRVLSDI
jgi:hypothetical protein